ncbi:MAG: glycosyltransferase family 39 protein [Solirubrobacteraceae bacterium]
MRRLIVALLLGAALAVRLAFVAAEPYHARNDAHAYTQLASEVAGYGDYHSGSRPAAGGTLGPTAYFPPAFPYLLAVADLLDGHPTAVGPHRIEMAALGTVSVGLVGLVALEAFGAGPALAALALATFYPVMIELSGTLVAENLVVALELAAAWAMLRARRAAGRRVWAWIAAAGALTGVAALAHENAAVYALGLGAGGWTVLRARGLKRAHALAGPAVLVAATCLAIAPWTLRNAVELHHFVPISDETGITLAGTYNPVSAADPRVPYKWRLFSHVPQLRHYARHASGQTEVQLSAELEAAALRYIGAHPVAPLQAAADNTLRMFELEGTYAWRASAAAVGLRLGAARIGVYAFWTLCLLAIAGAFTPAARRSPWWLWTLPLLWWITTVAVNVETPRFREPIDPFLVALAGCAVAAAVRRLSGLGGAPVRRRRLA